MGVNDQMSNHGGGESIQGLIQQNDTKSQVSQAYSQQSSVSAVTYATDQLGITD